MPLQVIVIGAGIAGVTAAVSLHQAGHKVKIHEKSKFASEIGAALNCAPNGALALQKLGFDFAKAKGVRLDNWETIDGKSLTQIRNQDISQADKTIGAPFCAIHRNDLFQGLLELARLSDSELNGETDSIDLVLGAKILHVEVNEGIVRLEGGAVEEADLIVAADGIHSTIRPLVVDPSVDSSADTGLSAFRFLMPDPILQQSPAAQRLLAQKANGASLYVDSTSADGERHITWYACRGGELHNFVCIHPKREDEATTDILSQVLEEFGHFHPDIVEVLRLASDVRAWPLLARQPLASWSKGKTVLIGDAAHPMLPFGGQGANQAIEDGAALGIFMRSANATSVPEQLQKYVDFRFRRVARTQTLAMVRPGSEAEVIERVKEYMEPGISLPDAPQKRVMHDAAYDVVAEAERAITDL